MAENLTKTIQNAIAQAAYAAETGRVEEASQWLHIAAQAQNLLADIH